MKKLLLVFVITLSLFIFAHTNIDAAQFPLKKSSDPSAHYLVDQNNVPFLINGDTPWSLIGQVSLEDAKLYIDDAVAKGFNSLIITLVESYYADNAPANFYGVQPYTTPGKFSTPNEAYFTHADAVLNYAASKNLNIILAPNYLGWNGGGDGYWNELRDLNTEADARWFGEWVGNRYKNLPNLMYIWVNDTNPCGYNSTLQDCSMKRKITAMAAGVKSKDPNHLHTAHLSPEYSAVEGFSTTTPYNGFTIDFNVTYTYNPVHTKVLEDYNRNPVVPFIMFESHYERDWANAAPIQIRRQAYNSILSGAGGHHYGNNPIWHMNGKPGDNSTPWKQHLNDEARADMKHFGNLFNSRQWYKLIPDQTHQVLTAGYSSGQEYVGAALTSDANTFIAYLPSATKVTINMDKIAGSQAKAWWFNPRDGSSSLIGSYPTSGFSEFTSLQVDNVLVIDNADLNLKAPGIISTSTTTPTMGPTATNSPTPIPVPGDANGDGLVDGVDYVIWLNHYNQNVSGVSNGDFNNDGVVDGIDYVVWLNNYSS